MENAIVTDGCDLVDSGSTLEAIGGSGGTVHTVQINANAYSPQNVNIKEGDTVRWRERILQQQWYWRGSRCNCKRLLLGNFYDNEPWFNIHKTFSTAGTYDYYCSVNPWMYGSVIVATGTSGGFSSVGVNVVGTNDDITLDGTSVSGFNFVVKAIRRFNDSDW